MDRLNVRFEPASSFSSAIKHQGGGVVDSALRLQNEATVSGRPKDAGFLWQ